MCYNYILITNYFSESMSSAIIDSLNTSLSGKIKAVGDSVNRIIKATGLEHLKTFINERSTFSLEVMPFLDTTILTLSKQTLSKQLILHNKPLFLYLYLSDQKMQEAVTNTLTKEEKSYNVLEQLVKIDEHDSDIDSTPLENYLDLFSSFNKPEQFAMLTRKVSFLLSKTDLSSSFEEEFLRFGLAKLNMLLSSYPFKSDVRKIQAIERIEYYIKSALYKDVVPMEGVLNSRLREDANFLLTAMETSNNSEVDKFKKEVLQLMNAVLPYCSEKTWNVIKSDERFTGFVKNNHEGFVNIRKGANKIVGVGCYGVVSETKEDNNGSKLVLKQRSVVGQVAQSSKSASNDMGNEITVLQYLCNTIAKAKRFFPSIGQVLTMVNGEGVKWKDPAALEKNNRIEAFTLEKIEGSSLESVLAARTLTNNEKTQLKRQALEIVTNLNQYNVCYNDLHSGNFIVKIVDGEYKLYIIDFGAAKILNPSEKKEKLSKNLQENKNYINHSLFKVI